MSFAKERARFDRFAEDQKNEKFGGTERRLRRGPLDRRTRRVQGIYSFIKISIFSRKVSDKTFVSVKATNVYFSDPNY